MKTLFPVLIFCSILLTGCGKNGFQSIAPTGSDSNGGQGTDGGTGGGSGGETPPTWEKVEMNGYPTGGTNAGQLVIYIDKANQSLLMVLPIPMLFPVYAPIPIPDLEGAYLASYTDAQGGTSLAVNVPLRHLVRDGEFGANERLPNGDPLPYVPSGELPGFAIQFPHSNTHKIHLYIGVNVAAAFVELPDFGLPFGATFPVKNAAKTKTVGAIGYVTPKGAFAGGVYLAAQIPDELAAVIDDLIRW